MMVWDKNMDNTKPTFMSPIPLPDQSVFEIQTFSDKKSKKQKFEGTASKAYRCPSPPTKSPPVSRISAKKKNSLFTPFAQPIGSPAPHSATPMPVGQKFFEQQFTQIRELGRGSFGEVYEVKSNHDGSLYAVKKKKRQFRGTTDRRRAIEEYLVGKHLPTHPHTLQYYSAWEENGVLYIQTELCTSSLKDLLDSKQSIPEKKIWDYLLDMALGLKHIHDHHYVHLDMKPGNILVGTDGHLKVGDLGLAVNYRQNHSDFEEGDACYMAPELLNEHKVIGPAADVFSLGVTIYEMATDVEIPASGNMWALLRSGNSTLSPSSGAPRRSTDLEELVKRMLNPKPAERITLSEILRHKNLVQLLKRRIQTLSSAKNLRSRSMNIKNNTLSVYMHVLNAVVFGKEEDPSLILDPEAEDKTSTSDSSFEEITEDDDDSDQELLLSSKPKETRPYLLSSIEMERSYREQLRRESFETMMMGGRKLNLDDTQDSEEFNLLGENSKLKETDDTVDADFENMLIDDDDDDNLEDDDQFLTTAPAVHPKNLMDVFEDMD